MPKMFDRVEVDLRFVRADVLVPPEAGLSKIEPFRITSTIIAADHDQALAIATWLRAGQVSAGGEVLHQCQFICQGCGTVAPGYHGASGGWHKPHHWFERSDEDGAQTACSRECIDTIAKKTGKTGVVLPI